MKLGMNIRNWGPTAEPEFLRRCAEAADDSTLDAIWFNDHIGLPPEIGENEYGIADDMGSIVDPLAFASFLAAVTERIRFGTAVLVLPYRPMIVTAKLLASIQVLSGNRFLLGVGPGYLAEEFTALGVPRSRRGRITDETLSFIHAASEDPLIEMHGQPLFLRPRLSRPPIYVGGKAAVAIPRALRYGDGWMPVSLSPAELAPHAAALQDQAHTMGRPAMEVVAMKTLPLAERAAACDLAHEYREAGVTHLVHTQAYESPNHYAEIVDILEREIGAAVR
ncbi:MAG: TIGR03619 family F420-dependent LLM class oxidoreductase [Gammaproteobacteria bacterium]